MDFPLYELFDQHRMFDPSLFDGLANLKASMHANLKCLLLKSLSHFL